MSVEPPQQRIWPLFVLAGAVVAFGTWLAFASPKAVADAGGAPEPFITQLPTAEIGSGADVVTLVDDRRAREFEVDLRQERTDGSNVVRTRFLLTMVETAARSEGQLLEWERSFTGTDISMSSNGESFGADVAHEVERLIETARVRVRAKSTGEVVDTSVVSAEAAQLRQLLSVLQSAIDAMFPRVPREAVRIGETWQWSAPVRANAPDELALGADGKMDVRASVVGHTDGAVLIDMKLEGSVDLELNIDEQVAISQKGSGRGQVVWDLDTGFRHGDLRWEQGDDVTTTRVRLQLTRKTRTE